MYYQSRVLSDISSHTKSFFRRRRSPEFISTPPHFLTLQCRVFSYKHLKPFIKKPQISHLHSFTFFFFS
ncbi:hypothetical protein QVD17_36789 [Tagetes erecta]|uniref:Uncharacterized protein n=1 Tax=Tagetes erecta TaxID=13708 RepID=A0AAD8NHN6_TARER|nr:hypothetical protein QVD17_36789 [Tagetes erecta]